MSSSMNSPAKGTGAARVANVATGGDARFVVFVLAIGLLIRAAFLFVTTRNGLTYIKFDEVEVAQRMIAGQGFSFDYYSLFGDEPTVGAFWPPAYVFNVYVLLRLFQSSLAISIENVFLSLAVPLCLFQLARRIFGQATARIVLFLGVLYPPFFIRITHGSPVYFKMLLMVLLVVLLYRAWHDWRSRDGILAGAIGGVLSLAMPDALVYLALFAAVAIVAMPRWAPRYRVAILVMTTAALVVAPWTLRNWSRFHQVCLVSSNGGFNFYMGNNAKTHHEVDYSNITELDRKLGGELARADEFERDRILRREGVRFIVENPRAAALNFLKRSLLHWGFRPQNAASLFGSRTADNPGGGNFVIYIWIYLLTYTAMLIAAFLGFMQCRPRWHGLAPIWLTFVYSTLLAVVFIVQTKMRLIKVEPFLLLFAACWLAGFIKKRPRLSTNPALAMIVRAS